MFIKTVVTAVALLFSVVIDAAGPSVKQSSSGICHPPESSWYERTTNYKAFDSLPSCLDAGGRLPKGMSLRDIQARRNPTSEYQPYDRDAFRHWVDDDGDCQDTRAELLIAESTIRPTFAYESKQCRVVSGRWLSPFTGQPVQNSDGVEIDHVVPLKWAWERGAWKWSGEQRERFANGMVNLMAVEGELNSSKGGRGPDVWLPPSGQCGYVARFSRVVKIYDLAPRPHEKAWIRGFLDKCR